MSTWHILEGTVFDPPDDGIVVEWPCDDVLDVAALDTRDAESDPDESDLTDQIIALLPPGAAWGTPDGEAHDPASEMSTFWRGFAKMLKPLYAQAFTTTLESTVSTITNSLEDWEIDLGLPDPCLGGDQTVETRLRSVISKVLASATITPGDFLCLADRLGFAIRIEEPEVFECGISECALDHEAATINLDVEWVVHLAAGPSDYFEAGIGEAGETRLLDWPANTELECILRPLRPAWSLLYFDYSEIIGD